ncbi:EF-hand domain-containing protein [Burkholderia perseverans]|uniref:EF-hand domain-containing protein n=1 Tax=Burkholderia perseverans TaxID=2615214 RepID=UPI001FF041F2|nr:EF-hand domain-containing protein [Burkholderia perseverans]
MKRLCLMLLAAFAVSPAFAQNAMMEKLQARFTAADTDHDGKLTPAEAQAGMPRVAKNFDAIDADHKGYVTVDDIVRFAASRRK